MEHVVKRSMSFALLALHLLVFALGGVRSSASGATSATATVHRVVVVATSNGGDGSAIALPDNGRLERGSRARPDRRHAAGLALDVLIPRGFVTVGRPALIGLRDWRSAARGHRALPCVVNGARGPPPAAV